MVLEQEERRKQKQQQIKQKEKQEEGQNGKIDEEPFVMDKSVETLLIKAIEQVIEPDLICFEQKNALKVDKVRAEGKEMVAYNVEIDLSEY